MHPELNGIYSRRIKIVSIIIILFLFPVYLFGQDTTYTFDLFRVKLEGNILKALNSKNELVFERSFNNPVEDVEDLDNDGVDEFLISDSKTEHRFTYYTFYIFNTIDSFYVADSIDSGVTEPYPFYSNEIKSMIIVCGNPKFNSFNKDTSETFLPLQCWKYDNDRITKVNDELYDFFITENDSLIDYIDSYLENNKKDCNTTVALNAILTSVYVNYINAGEKILANQLLKKYYFCGDVDAYKQKVKALL